MSIIILEGCDGAGKSTLAKELQRLSGFEIVQGSSFEISEMGQERMFDYMMGLLDRKNIIIDRYYMSNFVYGNLYDYPTMSSTQFKLLANKTEKKALTVYVTATEGTLKGRLLSRGDDRVRTERIDSILKKYSEALSDNSTLQSSFLQVDSTLTDVTKSAPMVLEFAELQERKMYMNRTL